MDALDPERKADRRQRSTEAREQLVVPAALSDGDAVRGVVDLKDRARVVTEAPHQTQVEDDPLGRLRGQQPADRAQPSESFVKSPGAALEHFGAASGAGDAQEQ